MKEPSTGGKDQTLNTYKTIHTLSMSPNQKSISASKHEAAMSKTSQIIEKLRDVLHGPRPKNDQAGKNEKRHPTDLEGNYSRFSECMTQMALQEEFYGIDTAH